MERSSPGARRKPGAFGASGTSDSHAIISSCSLHITRVCSLEAVLRPPAAPAPPAPLPLFSSCKFVAVLLQAVRVRVFSLAAVLRPSVLRSSVLRPSVLRSTSGGAASGRTGASGATQRGFRPHRDCGAAESGFIGRRRRLCRAVYLPTDAGL
jgi:hypothetical protein